MKRPVGTITPERLRKFQQGVVPLDIDVPEGTAERWKAAIGERAPQDWDAPPPINSRWRGWRLLALMSWDAAWHRHGAGALPPDTQAPATRG